MATNNINKIVRGNLNLKPWIFSKNPSDIVNSYVQKLYQQLPNHFKKDIVKPRIAKPQAESPAPLRALKTPVERFPFPIVNKPKSKLRTNGYRSPPQPASKNSFLAATSTKKLLKSPNFKIYTTRKYASSASSSSASFFRSYEDRRKKMYKPANGIQIRSFTAAAALSGTNSYNTPGIAKYIAPKRIFNEVTNQIKSLEITNTICKDLMSVDEMLKKKIRVVRPKVVPGTVELNKTDILENSFSGWNHPATSQMTMWKAQAMSNKPAALKKYAPSPRANDEIPEKLHNVKPLKRKQPKMNPSTPPRRENARFQVHNFPQYMGAAQVPPRMSGSPNATQRSKVEPAPKTAEKSPDFVCRSRAPRNLAPVARISNHKSAKKPFRNY